MTIALDLLGAAALIASGYLLAGPWLALLLFGLLALTASWKASR